MPNPTIQEIDDLARLYPHLDFFFSNGRLHISRSPPIRLPVKGTSSGKHHSIGSYEIADWQPSDLIEVF